MLSIDSPNLLEQLIALGGAELFLLPLRHASSSVRVACLRVINLVLAHPDSVGLDTADERAATDTLNRRRRKNARDRLAANVASQTTFANALADILTLHVCFLL